MMNTQDSTPRAPETTNAGLDATEELLAEKDEPPDERQSQFSWSPPGSRSEYSKAAPNFLRRESLLTRQLHSETDHTDDERAAPVRALSTQSTWSNPSTTSTAELTSDDGFSVPSPGMSPPLPAAHASHIASISEKPLEHKLEIVAEEDAPDAQTTGLPEKSLEENLGRKRCITFACRGKQDAPTSQAVVPEPAAVEPVSPPKRKCMLKFVCPTRAGAEVKSIEHKPSHSSPPPSHVRHTTSMSVQHRGSDSTVTDMSTATNGTPGEEQAVKEIIKDAASKPMAAQRRYSIDSLSSDSGNEGTRFHEFATSEEEKDDWVQESTVYRSRLTVNDTLEKENILRKACAEVEQEVLEDEEDDEQEDLEEELEATAGSAQVDDLDNADEDESDEGFHSDDEEGFANSDSESDESDFEWWKPSGRSTAATSIEHLDRLAIVNSQPHVRGSSIGSASSDHASPHSSKVKIRRTGPRRGRTPALNIKRSQSPGPPDFADFVCGTLDEDRPLEQAYIEHRNVKQAAKHGFRPQDIDPTFPTSDPDMDEEDDDDVDDVGSSDAEEEHMMHGNLEEFVSPTRAKCTSPPQVKNKGHATRSPPPPATTRLQSPPPSKKRSSCRSPPPIKCRGTVKSAAPRTLFSHSPTRAKSPAPPMRMTSPPNSPAESSLPTPLTPSGLAGRPLGGRPQLTHTASLPRGGGITLSRLGVLASEPESDGARTITDIPKRGAIDIVKGLEKKRQRRKEKLYQKACAKAATKAKEAHRVKPGTGAERMREVGLQLQQYHGKAEHILSL